MTWFTTNPPIWKAAITFPLGRSGKFAMVDLDDDDLTDVSWFLVDGYVVRNNPNAPPVRINLHRVIMERILNRPLQAGEIVDHKNGDRLDCCRNNLRLATRQTNGQNRPANRNNQSGYKGVSWFKAARKWRATLSIGAHHITIGYFDTLRDAVIAYNSAALEHFGEFAYLNPVPPEASSDADVAQK